MAYDRDYGQYFRSVAAVIKEDERRRDYLGPALGRRRTDDPAAQRDFKGLERSESLAPPRLVGLPNIQTPRYDVTTTFQKRNTQLPAGTAPRQGQPAGDDALPMVTPRPRAQRGDCAEGPSRGLPVPIESPRRGRVLLEESSSASGPARSSIALGSPWTGQRSGDIAPACMTQRLPELPWADAALSGGEGGGLPAAILRFPGGLPEPLPRGVILEPLGHTAMCQLHTPIKTVPPLQGPRNDQPWLFSSFSAGPAREPTGAATGEFLSSPGREEGIAFQGTALATRGAATRPAAGVSTGTLVASNTYPPSLPSPTASEHPNSVADSSVPQSPCAGVGPPSPMTVRRSAPEELTKAHRNQYASSAANVRGEAGNLCQTSLTNQEITTQQSCSRSPQTTTPAAMLEPSPNPRMDRKLFPGRVDMLDNLLDLPAIGSSGPLQRAGWTSARFAEVASASSEACDGATCGVAGVSTEQVGESVRVHQAQHVPSVNAMCSNDSRRSLPGLS